MSDIKATIKEELGPVVDRAELANAIAKLRMSLQFFDSAMYNYDQAVVDELAGLDTAELKGPDFLRVNYLLSVVNNFIPTPHMAFEDDEDGLTVATDMFMCAASTLSEALTHLYAACPALSSPHLLSTCSSNLFSTLTATYPVFLTAKGWDAPVEKEVILGLRVYGSLLDTLIEYQSETKG